MKDVAGCSVCRESLIRLSAVMLGVEQLREMSACAASRSAEAGPGRLGERSIHSGVRFTGLVSPPSAGGEGSK